MLHPRLSDHKSSLHASIKIWKESVGAPCVEKNYFFFAKEHHQLTKEGYAQHSGAAEVKRHAWTHAEPPHPKPVPPVYGKQNLLSE